MLRFAIVALCLAPVALTDFPGDSAARPTSVLAADPESASDAFPEYKIKAAFLYNFIRYTTWAEGALGGKNEPIELLVVGNDPFGKTLHATFEGKELHGRKVVIRHTRRPPEKLKAALVFAKGLSAEDEASLLKACKGKPILLIGDEKGLAEKGACANFHVEEKKVRFQVNTEVAKANKLAISSQLLKLAQIVKTKRRTP